MHEAGAAAAAAAAAAATVMLIVGAAIPIGLGEATKVADAEKPLILSPFIAAGKIRDARRMAIVNDVDATLSGYSGFLTVNKSCNSNMFFWLVPSQGNPSTDPVTVWLNGGPGTSSLLGLFTENGPWRLTPDEHLVPNGFSWNLRSSMLYVDNPVGTGFSFTATLDCYCKDETQVASNFVLFLQEFFRLFPALKKNRFFMSGESYAGKYIPAIAYAMLTGPTDIRLDGIIIGNGLIDPINQLHYAEHFYQLGLVDDRIKSEMEKAEGEAKALINSGKYAEAATKRVALIENIFGKNAGYNYFYNFLFADGVPKGNIRKFVNRKAVRAAIHVGNATYANSTLVSQVLYRDIMQSVRPRLEYVLDKCRVLLYYGQMDLRDSYVASRGFISDLKWSGKAFFKRSSRKPWMVGKKLAGYTRIYGNLAEVMIRNAGHFAPMDQPEWVLEMYNKFIFNETYH